MNALDDRMLEALVDGELNEADRAEVLCELDHATDGWRRLALAFLEDQAMRQTFGRPADNNVAELARIAPRPGSNEPNHGIARRLRLRRWSAGLAACAACAVIAFLLGTWTGRSALPAPSGDPGFAGRSVEPGSPPKPAPEEPAPKQVASSMPNLSPSTRKELERRGFSVNERPRVVSVRQDGRTIQVLVNEIELRYVGRHSAL